MRNTARVNATLAREEDEIQAMRITSDTALPDGEELQIHTNGQTWLLSWHPPGDPPSGTPHGAAGICRTSTGEIVLIRHDGREWDFPAGRPEADESARETLRRELLEEACVAVHEAQLLGLVRSRCVYGHEEGLVLVRSFWLADVNVQPWSQCFETSGRCMVPPQEVLCYLSPVFTAVNSRALSEAGLACR